MVTSNVCGIRATVKESSSSVDDGQTDAVDRNAALGGDLRRESPRHAESQMRPGRIVATFDQFTHRIDVAGDVMATQPIADGQRIAPN